MQKISYCICKKTLLKCLFLVTDFSLIRFIKTEQKAILKATLVSKKLKYIDDPVVAKEAWVIALRDKWIIKEENPPPDTKA